MAGKLWLSQNKINLIPTPTPSPRKALHYSDDTPYWHPILYSPLFILYWRRQIPLHSPRKSCDPLNPATPSPPPPVKLCIILIIPLIGSQFSIVPSLYSPPFPPPKARILTGLKVKLLFTRGILHLISGWQYNKLFEGLFLFQKIIIV